MKSEEKRKGNGLERKYLKSLVCVLRTDRVRYEKDNWYRKGVG